MLLGSGGFGVGWLLFFVESLLVYMLPCRRGFCLGCGADQIIHIHRECGQVAADRAGDLGMSFKLPMALHKSCWCRRCGLRVLAVRGACYLVMQSWFIGFGACCFSGDLGMSFKMPSFHLQ